MLLGGWRPGELVPQEIRIYESYPNPNFGNVLRIEMKYLQFTLNACLEDRI